MTGEAQNLHQALPVSVSLSGLKCLSFFTGKILLSLILGYSAIFGRCRYSVFPSQREMFLFFSLDEKFLDLVGEVDEKYCPVLFRQSPEWNAVMKAGYGILGEGTQQQGRAMWVSCQRQSFFLLQSPAAPDVARSRRVSYARQTPEKRASTEASGRPYPFLL